MIAFAHWRSRSNRQLCPATSEFDACAVLRAAPMTLFSPRGGMTDFGHAAIFTLRAHAAQIQNFRYGLPRHLRRMICKRLFWEGMPFAAPRINWKDADEA